jgi:D-glycero-D-manno-heptose 1,7-bisphosphate phosphatase
MKRAVFIDRDGTINIERHYLCDPAQFVMFPGVERALRQLQEAGFLLFVVTNQSGIGRGYYTEADMHRVHDRMNELLGAEKVGFQKIYYAPEHPDHPSRGRKPSPQFLFDARDEYGVDLSKSYMIGDKIIDVEAGWNAGCAASILVRTGYGADVEREKGAQLKNAVVVDDLLAASDWILASGKV